MKVVHFEAPGLPAGGGYGVWEEDGTIRMIDPEEGRVYRVEQVTRWLPPVAPPNVICLGKNYAEHAKEGFGGVPERPVVFLKPTTTVSAHREKIVLPKEHPDEVDYEAELAIVIGHEAKNVAKEEALECVLGFTCAQDVSARDCQFKLDQQWARAKGFDGFCPLGPCLVDDLDPSDLRIQMRLNGKVMQDARTSDMMFDVPTTISYLSRNMTLLPGTVILTGTPSGVGFAQKPPRFLREGDMLEVEIEGIGVLENEVVREA